MWHLDNGDVYKGECLDGIPHGKVRCEYATGEVQVQEGAWVNGGLNGHGKCTSRTAEDLLALANANMRMERWSKEGGLMWMGNM